MKKFTLFIITLLLTSRLCLFAQQSFIGEIQIFAGNFAPAGWAICDGSLLPISENDALFALIGTTYGGDGQNTFALPDLRGRIPVHQGQGPGLSSYVIGQMSGTETVTLTTNQLPSHAHLETLTLPVSSALGDKDTPENNYFTVNPSRASEFSSNASNALMAPALNISGNSDPAGGNQTHENRMPYLVVNYIISLYGIFPSQN
jgi:microcystin-dependent protein